MRLCSIQVLNCSWVIPRSHCHLLRSEGVWGERTWVGALFFSPLRGSERAIHKNFRAWVIWGVSWGDGFLLKNFSFYFRSPFACLFVSSGPFGPILVIEIPKSMVWCRKGDPFLALSNLISYGIRPLYHLLHELFMRLWANTLHKLNVAEWMCPFLCRWRRRGCCHPLCRSGRLYCGASSIASRDVVFLCR